MENKFIDFLKKMSIISEEENAIFQYMNYERSLFPLKYKNIYQAERFSMNYEAVRRRKLANENVVWQLDGKYITILPIILSHQTIQTEALNIIRIGQ